MTVDIEINLSILFGLEMGIGTIVNSIGEILMKNSNVLIRCVWCGVAFLRADVWDISNPDERLVLSMMCHGFKRNVEKVRLLLPAPICFVAN